MNLIPLERLDAAPAPKASLRARKMLSNPKSQHPMTEEPTHPEPNHEAQKLKTLNRRALNLSAFKGLRAKKPGRHARLKQQHRHDSQTKALNPNPKANAQTGTEPKTLNPKCPKGRDPFYRSRSAGENPGRKTRSRTLGFST